MSRPRKVFILCGFVLCILSTLGTFTVITNSSVLYQSITEDNENVHQRDNTFTISGDIPYTITRRQAIIDYLKALYSEKDGAFYGYLTDTPTFPKAGSVPDIFSIYDPFRVFERLNAIEAQNWSTPKEFLKELVNIKPKTTLYYGLVNFSPLQGPDVVASEIAIELFPKLGIADWLYKDQNANYIASAQTASGGFIGTPENPSSDRADMILTWTALEGLRILHRLDLIDTRTALEFIKSCYHEDGGFSYVPTSESDYSAVPLGIMCLSMLGHMDLLDINRTTEYILQFWDPLNGWAPSSDSVVGTEQLIWSLHMMNALNKIDINKTINKVLQCQTYYNGAFLPTPHSAPEDEKLVWCESATHILEMLGRLDVLEENITILHHPKYTVPQWWIDLINREYGNNTTNSPHFYVGTVDVLAFLSDWSIPLTFMVVNVMFVSYIHFHKKQQRQARRDLLKRRKRERR